MDAGGGGGIEDTLPDLGGVAIAVYDGEGMVLRAAAGRRGRVRSSGKSYGDLYPSFAWRKLCGLGAGWDCGGVKE